MSTTPEPEHKMTTLLPAQDDSPMMHDELLEDRVLDQIRGTILVAIATRCGQVPDVHPNLAAGINAAARSIAAAQHALADSIDAEAEQNHGGYVDGMRRAADLVREPYPRSIIDAIAIPTTQEK